MELLGFFASMDVSHVTSGGKNNVAEAEWQAGSCITNEREREREREREQAQALSGWQFNWLFGRLNQGLNHGLNHRLVL